MLSLSTCKVLDCRYKHRYTSQRVGVTRASIKSIKKLDTGGGDDDDSHDAPMIPYIRDYETNVRILNRMLETPTVDSQRLMDLMYKRWGKFFSIQVLSTSNNDIILDIKWQHYGLQEFPYLSFDDYKKDLDDIGYMLTVNGFASDIETRLTTIKDTPYAMMGDYKNDIRLVFKRVRR